MMMISIHQFIERTQKKNTTYDTRNGDRHRSNLAVSWHGMRRLILAGHRGSNGSGHSDAGSYMFHSTLPHSECMLYRLGRPMPAHVYAWDARTARQPSHKPSSIIDRFVVADGRAWRAASPTRLRSDLRWRCASLRLTALRRHYSPSSLLGMSSTRAALVEGMRSSEPSMVDWTAVDSAATRSHAMHTYT